MLNKVFEHPSEIVGTGYCLYKMICYIIFSNLSFDKDMNTFQKYFNYTFGDLGTIQSTASILKRAIFRVH